MRERMHADELDVDVELVRRLVVDQFPELAGLPIEEVPSSGTVNALYRLGDALVARLPLRRAWAGGIEHEHTWLPRLAPDLPVDVPLVLRKGAADEAYPCVWSVSSWIEGENPSPGAVEAPDVLAADLARFVRAMRRVDPSGAPPAYRGGPLSERDDDVRAAIEASRELVDAIAATTAWNAALRAPEWPHAPVWSHSDLLPGNVLLRNGRLTGVIDFAASGVGDPACDLMPAWSLLPASARHLFRAAVDVDDATWQRGCGWSLLQALIALPYYVETNPVMAQNARYAIGEVLAEYTDA